MALAGNAALEVLFRAAIIEANNLPQVWHLQRAVTARLRKAGIRMPGVLGFIDTRTPEDIARDSSAIVTELARLVENSRTDF
jgi:hypothetical protein